MIPAIWKDNHLELHVNSERSTTETPRPQRTHKDDDSAWEKTHNLPGSDDLSADRKWTKAVFEDIKVQKD